MKPLRESTISLSIAFMICLTFVSTTWPEEKKAEDHPIHERIEWSDIWVTNANKNHLPRVLLVGDSITRGYFGQVEKGLHGKANCARYTTSKFIGHEDYLAELKILLKRYQFKVIHINNGLHGFDYTEQQYKKSFPALMKLLDQHASDATLIWATTTPVRQRNQLAKVHEAKNARVIQRNNIALAIMKKQGVKVSDIFTLVIDHPEYHRGDGVHFNSKGTSAQGKYISEIVANALQERK